MSALKKNNPYQPFETAHDPYKPINTLGYNPSHFGGSNSYKRSGSRYTRLFGKKQRTRKTLRTLSKIAKFSPHVAGASSALDLITTAQHVLDQNPQPIKALVELENEIDKDRKRIRELPLSEINETLSIGSENLIQVLSSGIAMFDNQLERLNTAFMGLLAYEEEKFQAEQEKKADGYYELMKRKIRSELLISAFKHSHQDSEYKLKQKEVKDLNFILQEIIKSNAIAKQSSDVMASFAPLIQDLSYLRNLISLKDLRELQKSNSNLSNIWNKLGGLSSLDKINQTIAENSTFFEYLKGLDNLSNLGDIKNSMSTQVENMTSLATDFKEVSTMQKEDFTYKKSEQSIKDLDGNVVATVSPRQAQTIKDINQARKNTDENNFQLDDSDFDLFDSLDFTWLQKLNIKKSEFDIMTEALSSS